MRVDRMIFLWNCMQSSPNKKNKHMVSKHANQTSCIGKYSLGIGSSKIPLNQRGRKQEIYLCFIFVQDKLFNVRMFLFQLFIICIMSFLIGIRSSGLIRPRLQNIEKQSSALDHLCAGNQLCNSLWTQTSVERKETWSSFMACLLNFSMVPCV